VDSEMLRPATGLPYALMTRSGPYKAYSSFEVARRSGRPTMSYVHRIIFNAGRLRALPSGGSVAAIVL
jgi:hypothetical protein